RRRHTSFDCDWSSDVCSSDLRPAERAVNRYLPLTSVMVDSLIASTITDVNGKYLFTALSAGRYFVDVDESSLPSSALALTTADQIGRASCRERACNALVSVAT